MDALPLDLKPIEAAKSRAAISSAFARSGHPSRRRTRFASIWETTNRCSLLRTTCPRTCEELEPPSDMSQELFTSIVDRFPNIERVVLHGVGEPMMVAEHGRNHRDQLRVSIACVNRGKARFSPPLAIRAVQSCPDKGQITV